MAGALFETACVSQFYKRFSAFADPCSLYYYRSTDGLEVDLLIETGKTIYPVEIKLSSTIDYGRTSSLMKWLEISRIKDVHGLIISTSKSSSRYACSSFWFTSLQVDRKGQPYYITAWLPALFYGCGAYWVDARYFGENSAHIAR